MAAVNTAVGHVGIGTMNMTLLAILIAVNLPVYYFLWRLTFGCMEDFLECVRYWLTPDIISMFRGEYGEDFWGELKLFWWLALCVGAVAAEYALIHWLFLK